MRHEIQLQSVRQLTTPNASCLISPATYHSSTANNVDTETEGGAETNTSSIYVYVNACIIVTYSGFPRSITSSQSVLRITSFQSPHCFNIVSCFGWTATRASLPSGNRFGI